MAAVADKLALVLLGLFAALALAWALVLYTGAGSPTRRQPARRALRWTRAHPRLGRYTAAVIDPRRPESASLLLLAVCLFAVAWLWAWFSVSLLARGGPSLLDHEVHAFMFALRNPLADRLMAAMAAIGSAPGVGAGVGGDGLAAVAQALMAAIHWAAAIAGPVADHRAGRGGRHAASTDCGGRLRLPHRWR